MLVSSDDCKTIRPQHFKTTAHILRLDQVNKVFFSFFFFLWLSMKSCGSGTVWPWPQLQLSIHHDKNSGRVASAGPGWLWLPSQSRDLYNNKPGPLTFQFGKSEPPS